MTRTVVLLPSSKGKAAGGSGEPYAATLASEEPLAAPRRRVLDAVRHAAGHADDAGFARITGLGSRASTADREHHAGLSEAATMPANQRYTGIVHRNAGLADLDVPSVPAHVYVVSALLGLARLDDAVPDYRLELGASLAGVGGLATFWRTELAATLHDATAGARVWDLLPTEHARVWPASARRRRDVIQVRFLRPDGRPANAARAKVCKGQVIAALLRWPDAAPAELARRAEVGAGWALQGGETTLTATFND